MNVYYLVARCHLVLLSVKHPCGDIHVFSIFGDILEAYLSRLQKNCIKIVNPFHIGHAYNTEAV